MASERLSDERLDSLEHSHGMIESEYTPKCRSASYGNGCPGATDDSLDFWRRAGDALPSMLAEIRERRAADLSDEEREALAWGYEFVEMMSCGGGDLPFHRYADAFLAALDKLLAGGKP